MTTRVDRTATFDYKIPADGTYTLGIYDHLRSGGPGFAYRIEVTASEPELALSLPDRRRYEATHISVPQGNRSAVMLNASRKGFAGAIDVSALNLPEGVTVTPIQMPANRTTVPLLLSAAPDAKLRADLVNLVGKVAENESLQSTFSQRHQLLIGRNNSVVYDYYSDRSAISVSKKSPCTISIVQPQVPIGRSGSMNLQVKVDRGGYDADIPIRMLYNPPGIGSSGSIRIKKGTNEASIPLTANGSAQIGKWPLIVYASLSDNGTYEIATPPAELEVVDKFFNFTFPKTSAELGSDATVIVDVEVARDFPGKCEVELVGFPAGVTCENPKVEVKNDTEQISFALKISEKARVGQHKSLVARATITDEKGVIKQTQGTGTLQIDKPLPAPVKKPAPAKTNKPATAKPVAPKPVKEKPLSRLEQLRKMHKELRESAE